MFIHQPDKYKEEHASASRSNVLVRIERANKMLGELSSLKKTLKKSKGEKKGKTKKVKLPLPTPVAESRANDATLKRLKEIEKNLEKADYETAAEYKEFLLKVIDTNNVDVEIFEQAENLLDEVIDYLRVKKPSEPVVDAGVMVTLNTANEHHKVSEAKRNSTPEKIITKVAYVNKPTVALEYDKEYEKQQDEQRLEQLKRQLADCTAACG
jgi:hypothetical protein